MHKQHVIALRHAADQIATVPRIGEMSEWASGTRRDAPHRDASQPARRLSVTWSCAGVVLLHPASPLCDTQPWICKSLLCFCTYCIHQTGSRVSSVSIVSGYGLENRAIDVRPPAGSKDFTSSLYVQTGSGAHPTSCPMCTGGTSPGAKARPRCDANHSPPSSAEVVNE
jgi:hypothetical protein